VELIKKWAQEIDTLFSVAADLAINLEKHYFLPSKHQNNAIKYDDLLKEYASVK